jgi:hypothetical protein
MELQQLLDHGPVAAGPIAHCPPAPGTRLPHVMAQLQVQTSNKKSDVSCTYRGTLVPSVVVFLGDLACAVPTYLPCLVAICQIYVTCKKAPLSAPWRGR